MRNTLRMGIAAHMILTAATLALGSDGAVPIWEPMTITQPGSYVLTRDITDSDSVTLEITSVSDVRIDLNGFTVENTGGGWAITAFGADRLQVGNGRLVGGGLNAYACYDLLVADLTIANPPGSGISVEDSTAILRDNVISGTGQHGIDVWASEMIYSKATIVGNVIRNPTLCGIQVGYPYGSVVADNEILGGARGIDIYSGSGGAVRRNSVHGSDYGIYLLGADGTHVYQNTVRQCDLTGLYLEHSDFNHLEGNLLTDNDTGLHFDVHAENNLYRGNTSRGNTTADFVDSGTGNTSHRDNYMPNQI